MGWWEIQSIKALWSLSGLSVRKRKKRNSSEIISELGWVASACAGWGIASAQIISPGFVVTFPHPVLGCCLRDTECSHLRCSRFSTALCSVSAKQTPPPLVEFWFMLPNLGSRAWAPFGHGCCCCGCAWQTLAQHAAGLVYTEGSQAQPGEQV